MRTSRIALAALVVIVAAGCSGGNSGSADPAAKATEVKQSSAAATAKGDNVISPNATVINDPKQAQEGGSYRIAPANPNDKNFQPDPKLGGGG